MGGKSYFCDYCDCFMKNDVNVRNLHNSGLSHTIAKANYMRPFEDPRQLLAEEEPKAPCSRYHVKGYCRFDLFCQFSHYTPSQLEQLRKIAKRLDFKQQNLKTVKQTSNTEYDWKKILPWNAQIVEKNKKKRKSKLPRNLPPSLRPLKLSKIIDNHDSEVKWG